MGNGSSRDTPYASTTSSVSTSRMKVQMTPNQVQHLLDSGIEAGNVVRLLVATGAWTETGAAEIVATLRAPGPIDDPRPSSHAERARRAIRSAHASGRAVPL